VTRLSLFATCLLATCLLATNTALPGALKPAGTVWLSGCDTGTANSLAAGSHRAAAACGDGQLRIWNTTNGEVLQSIPIPSTPIDAVAISWDGRWILAADHAGKTTMWDSRTGKVTLQTQLTHYPSSIMFSRDSTTLAISAAGGPTAIFDVATAHKLYDVATTFGTAATAFSRDGRYFADADTDTAVRIYETKNGKLISENHDFKLEPFTVDFTKDGKQVIAAGADRVIAYIDTATGKVGRKSKVQSEPIVYLEVSPDGESLAVAFVKAENVTQPAPIAVWTVASAEEKSDWMPPGPITGAGWGSDGHFMVTTVDGKRMGVWQVP
jgi:WD40 repeat protein